MYAVKLPTLPTLATGRARSVHPDCKSLDPLLPHSHTHPSFQSLTAHVLYYRRTPTPTHNIHLCRWGQRENTHKCF